jgi:hypothetical protein
LIEWISSVFSLVAKMLISIGGKELCGVCELRTWLRSEVSEKSRSKMLLYSERYGLLWGLYHLYAFSYECDGN